MTVRRTFDLAYNVRDEDRYLKGARRSDHEEEDVEAFEDAAQKVSILDVLLGTPLRSSRSSARSDPLEDLLARRSLARRNVEGATTATTEVGAPTDDERMATVVVVLGNGGTSQGSGFYVSSDLVLTNAHVVEGSKFVELQLYRDGESFGKVIATDEVRDLALIRTQKVGRPARIYAAQAVPLGATVEAMGHPRGLTFSITRGIVSGMRERAELGVPVRHIQTDAAINPGNSGGPLWMGEHVVGVSTAARRDSEGLGFAVHCSEVLAFLRDADVAVAQH